MPEVKIQILVRNTGWPVSVGSKVPTQRVDTQASVKLRLPQDSTSRLRRETINLQQWVC